MVWIGDRNVDVDDNSDDYDESDPLYTIVVIVDTDDGICCCRDADICDYGINDYYNCNTYFIDTGNNRKKDAGRIVVFKRVIQIFIALNVRMVSMMVLLTVME